MQVEVNVSKLHPPAAAYLVEEKLVKNDDKAAAEELRSGLDLGPGTLRKSELENTITLLLTEHRHLLNDENEEWLREFSESY
jgi:hypothetical protein